ncbi:MAG: FIST C-terminal domain-containing protein [Saprospiraceae bacterium]|nr:FIST C-terminal domain-containing protein [Saprospiraceae bacterium]
MYIPNVTTADMLSGIESLKVSPGEVVMLLICEKSEPNIPELIAHLNEKPVVYFGAIFPGVIYGKKSYETGAIIVKFRAVQTPITISEIAANKFDGLNEVSSKGYTTAIVLVDGLSNHNYKLLEQLNNALGEHCDFIGAGAGFMDLNRVPCVFSNEGFFQDAAVVCIIKNEVKLGVRHGWMAMEGPLVATKVEGNVLYRLNWAAADHVYRQIVEKACGIPLSKENFMSISQGYPLGIVREMQDDIVRDPISIGAEGEIFFIGDIPPNAVLHVLKGDPDNLLSAARQAMVDCGADNNHPINAEFTFVVDCVTRAFYLNERFDEELELVHQALHITRPAQEPFGVLSLGEISSNGGGVLELFNKTIVIGAFMPE